MANKKILIGVAVLGVAGYLYWKSKQKASFIGYDATLVKAVGNRVGLIGNELDAKSSKFDFVSNELESHGSKFNLEGFSSNKRSKW